jgi:hypothetical protein
MSLKRKDMESKSEEQPDKRVKQGKAVSFHPTNRLKNFLEPTVWHHFTPLAIETKAVNLGA